MPGRDFIGDHRLLFWIRMGAVAACLLVGASSEASIWYGPKRQSVPSLVVSLALHVVVAALFWRNTTEQHASDRSRPWLLFLQIVLGSFDSNLSIINSLAIPLARPPGMRMRWMFGEGLSLLTTVVMAVLMEESARTVPQQEMWLALSLGVLETAVWCAVGFTAALLIVRVDEDRRRLAALNAELQSSRALLAEASRLGERLRISSELHDSMGHHLTTLGLNLQIASHVSAEDKDAHIERAQFLTTLLLADLREAVSSWRSEKFAALPDALRALVSGLDSQHLRARLEIDDTLPSVEPDLAHALLRCAQEALTNVLRHSNASEVEIVLSRVVPPREGLRLVVRDNGHGCIEIAPGNGLNGIAERIRAFGGECSLSSTPGEGFSVRVEAPLQRHVDSAA